MPNSYNNRKFMQAEKALVIMGLTDKKVTEILSDIKSKDYFHYEMLMSMLELISHVFVSSKEVMKVSEVEGVLREIGFEANVEDICCLCEEHKSIDGKISLGTLMEFVGICSHIDIETWFSFDS